VVSDGRLVVESNNQGVPFVLASPEAQVSRDVTAMAASLLKVPAPVAARR
jgi:MinD-like ATPase involved in chromosome partitioning or flagellar assembly